MMHRIQALFKTCPFELKLTRHSQQPEITMAHILGQPWHSAISGRAILLYF